MSAITSPFEVPAATGQGPQSARLEILERHSGLARYAHDYPLRPNTLRLNGRDLWATEDDPIVVHEIRVDGRPGSMLTVVLRFLARSLAVGVEPDEVDAPGLARRHFPVIAVPGLPDGPGEVAAPYVLVDETRLLLGGEVVVHSVAIGEDLDVLVVDVPLLCRSVRFDDELFDKA